MIKRTRNSFRGNRGYDQLNRALTGKGSGADHQLSSIASPDISDKTGVRRGDVLQYCVTAIGSGSEGPAKA